MVGAFDPATPAAGAGCTPTPAPPRPARDQPELLGLADCLASTADLQQVMRCLEIARRPPIGRWRAERSARCRPARPQRCSTVEVVEARTPVPADPAQHAQVEELRRQLVRADALRLAGHYREARAELEALRRRAEATGYRPLEAEVAHVLAQLSDAMGDYEGAERGFEQALWAAEAGGHDEIAARASDRPHRRDRQPARASRTSSRDGSRVTSMLERIGGDAEIEAELFTGLGTMAIKDGTYDRAEVELTRASPCSNSALAATTCGCADLSISSRRSR